MIVFIDETSFNLWMMPKKLWSRREDQEFYIKSNRGKSFTLIGAIDFNSGIRHYKVINGTNDRNTFSYFV